MNGLHVTGMETHVPIAWYFDINCFIKPSNVRFLIYGGALDFIMLDDDILLIDAYRFAYS